MHPLARGAAAAAVLTALGSLAPPERAPAPVVRPPAGGDGMAALCRDRTVPDGDACVPLPALGAAAPAPIARAAPDDHVPRRPDRPADFARYVWPASGDVGPDREVAAGALRPGVLVEAPRGAEVRAVALEHQEGPADVVFTGDLVGPTVITSHLVQEPGQARRYLVVHGRLADVSAQLGAKLDGGGLVGHVGEGAGLVGLYVETRQLRDAGAAAAGARLVDPAVSVVVDPRNVLGLAP